MQKKTQAKKKKFKLEKTIQVRRLKIEIKKT